MPKESASGLIMARTEQIAKKGRVRRRVNGWKLETVSRLFPLGRGGDREFCASGEVMD